MSIPDYQSIMLPLLKFIEDGNVHNNKEAVVNLARYFNLSNEEIEQTYLKNQKCIFYDRINWAKSYMKQAGLIEYPKRSIFKITEEGIKLLNSNPIKIDFELLKNYKPFVNFLNRSTKKSTSQEVMNDIEESAKTPAEQLSEAYEKIKADLIQEILSQIKDCSPAFFEKLVIELLVKMGYGGTIEDAGQTIGKTGDHGIDGVIKEDRLGLDIIYIQAKKWNDTIVGRPEIQKFVGALQEKRSKKGIFITTSTFSDNAREYVTKIDNKVVLIDGNDLAEYMIDYNLGLNTIDKYEIKRIDSDYYQE